MRSPISTRDNGNPAQEDPVVTATVACRITGITYRQLDYWLRTGVIEVDDWNSFGFIELRELREIKSAADTGEPLARIRERRQAARDA